MPRTLIDLAAVVPPASLSAALDDALTRRLVTCGYIERRLDQLGRQGRKGAGVLAELLSQRSKSGPAPESAFERRLFAILAASDVPLPVPQYEVSLPGGRRARLDFAYPQRLLALEADSYRYHSSPRDWARDHNRNRELTAAGWRILPVTWDDLDAPAHLLAAVARGLSISRRLAG